jgi:hypothetical protein
MRTLTAPRTCVLGVAFAGTLCVRSAAIDAWAAAAEVFPIRGYAPLDRSRLEAAAEGVIEARANRPPQEHGCDAREALSKRN